MVSVNFILLILLLPPFLLMTLLAGKKLRMLLLFMMYGIVSAYLSGLVNSAILTKTGMTVFDLTINVSPIVEEFFKAAPLVLLIAFVRPEKRYVLEYAVAIGLGFAFFENAWAFSQAVSASPTIDDVCFALSRGFGASLVHSLCTLILTYGIRLCMHKKKLLFTGSFALFSFVCLFHSLFNVLIQSGYVLAPFLLTVCTYIVLLIGLKSSGFKALRTRKD